ncbi:MAG: response regulator [Candidatus Omnitrophica bacterium]|nr:response regulator [Candidatus Omnitrophota bacterium]
MAKKILIIDDEINVTTITRVRLELEGYQVKYAYTAETGLEKLMSEPFDLLLLDVVLPDVDGCTLARQIRSHPALKDLPIILFTAGKIKDLEQRVREIGVNDSLQKPFDKETLLTKVKNIIGS